MTLPVKNSNRLFVAVLTVLTVLVSGCTEEVTAPTLDGNIAQPTWTAPENHDFSSSMTAVVKVSLLEQYPSMATNWQLNDSDLVAAFIGNDCLGVTAPQEGLFFLYISGPSSGSETISLRYYSAFYKNIFEAKDAFPFVNDDHLGTVAQPLIPTFVVVK